MKDLIDCLKRIDSQKAIYLDDVTGITGITPRNIKFWVQEYKLKTIRQGRKNQYPKETVCLLVLIQTLSESRFFTKKYQDILIKQCQGTAKSKIRHLKEYERLMYNLDQIHYYLSGISVWDLENIDERIIDEGSGFNDYEESESVLSSPEVNELLEHKTTEPEKTVAPKPEKADSGSTTPKIKTKSEVEAKMLHRKSQINVMIPTGILQKPEGDRRKFLSGLFSKFKR